LCTVLAEQVSESIDGVQIEEKRVLLAGKVACSGITFLLLAIGISGPRPTPLPSGANAGKEGPGIAHPDNVMRMQQTLHDEGHYRGKVDGVFGLRTRASIRAYQKAENLPLTGQLDTQTAARLGITAEVRDENGYETPRVKPSAGIKWADGSRRKSKLPRKTVTTNGTATVPPA
jgi:peptidoglycan hydrolase-like protein with peptidoglycan-binding domain